MIENILIDYSNKSMICLFKVDSFNQLHICLWMEYGNISDHLDFYI